MESKELLFMILLCIGLISFIVKPLRIKLKGALGERRVNKKLKRSVEGGKLYKNYIMLDDNGMSHQIDSILVNKRGVFVIETKNYRGTIYGTDNKERWTQRLGFKRNTFYSPVSQNAGHIRSLRAFIPDSIDLKNIVVFTGKNNLKNVKSNYTVKDSKLVKRIKAEKKCLSKKEVKAVIDALDRNRSSLTTREHVANIKELQKQRRNKDEAISRAM